MELTADILEEFIAWQARGRLPDLSAQEFLDEKNRECLITNAGSVISMIETGEYWAAIDEEMGVLLDVGDRQSKEDAINSIFEMIKADLMEGVAGSV